LNSITAIRKEAGLLCGFFLRKGEKLASGGSIQHPKNLKAHSKSKGPDLHQQLGGLQPVFYLTLQVAVVWSESLFCRILVAFLLWDALALGSLFSCFYNKFRITNFKKKITADTFDLANCGRCTIQRLKAGWEGTSRLKPSIKNSGRRHKAQ